MVASDLAITKANRVTVKELDALGIPSISISHGLNPIDDVFVERINGNTALRADVLEKEVLAQHIHTILMTQPSRTSQSQHFSNNKNERGAVRAADRIAEDIRKWFRQTTTAPLSGRKG